MIKKGCLDIYKKKIPLVNTSVAVVGSGVAALNAAVHLKRFGIDDVIIVTEGLGAGTSANAGSDKQTYYRLSPEHGTPDSVHSMAEDLFGNGCMHGDIALVESALSLREFYHLVELGVPFPHSRYGDYVGFKTDHDLKSRGTSAGPRTSIMMYECLLKEARLLNIPVKDNAKVIEILTADDGREKKVTGLIAVEKENVLDERFGLIVIKADYVVYATGGPGALYEDSIYPVSQVGSSGIALNAGAVAQNLTESQFGIASKGFSWNLSGSYQQVLPRYISRGADGGEEREFLTDYFPSPEILIEAQFLKGYQWPFDIRKISNFGSSSIDLLVYYETKVRKRRVFLDFTRNLTYPGFNFSIDSLPDVVKEYLESSGATSDTPVERLKEMNAPAYETFLQDGIDLEKEPIEIAVCNQHCNGGLVGSIWWESNIRNLFPVGEVNGSHGIYRPGGSALNSAQVGSLRASQMIAIRIKEERSFSQMEFSETARERLHERLEEFQAMLTRPTKIDPIEERKDIQRRMSKTLGIIRTLEDIDASLKENSNMIDVHNKAGIVDMRYLVNLLENEDFLVTERLFLEANKEIITRIGKGRGSYIIGDIGDVFILDGSGKIKDISAKKCDDKFNKEILEIGIEESGEVLKRFVRVRPIPDDKHWFEKVWCEYRSGEIFR